MGADHTAVVPLDLRGVVIPPRDLVGDLYHVGLQVFCIGGEMRQKEGGVLQNVGAIGGMISAKEIKKVD